MNLETSVDLGRGEILDTFSEPTGGEQQSIRAKVLRPDLYQWGVPKRASTGSAGLDLVACLTESLEIKAGERALIPSGMAIQMKDPRLCAMILSRSGLGAKEGLTVAQGVGLIDSDYTGELKIMLLNTSSETRTVEPGQRIAQLLFLQHQPLHLEWVDELESTERGSGGFGSTGMMS